MSGRFAENGTVSRWCFNYDLLPTCHWKGAPVFDLRCICLWKFQHNKTCRTHCRHVWCNMKSEAGRSSSRKGTMGAGRDNYIFHFHSSRERVWSVLKYFGVLHKTNYTNTLFQSIWEYCHWYSANSNTVNLVIFVDAASSLHPYVSSQMNSG